MEYGSKTLIDVNSNGGRIKAPNLFIIGLPRSGTKLLRALLDNHSKIFFPDLETTFIPRLIRSYGSGELSRTQFIEIAQEVKKSIFFFYYLQTRSFDFSKIQLDTGSLEDFLNIFFEELAHPDLLDLSYIGDKSPGNIVHLELLGSYFPDAKFIHIVRDPRDVALSVKNAWNKSMLRTVVKWVRGVEAFRDVSSKNSDNMIEIRYEDLVSKPDRTLKFCTDFLNLCYEPEMANLRGSIENLGDAKSTRIEANNTNKHITKMRARHISQIEEHTVEQLRHYGYKFDSKRLKNKSIPVWKEFILTISDGLSLLYFNVREHGLSRGIEKIFKALK